MSKDKKYYWLQLKNDWFEREEIKLIEAMDNGKDYIIFYLKVLLKSLENGGNLKFRDVVPYNEKMLSTITNTNVDIVEKAIKVFLGFDLLTIFDDGTLYLKEVKNMVGNETKWAEYKRQQRTSSQLDIVQSKSKASPKKSNKCPSILDIDLDIDINLSPKSSLERKEEREDFKKFKERILKIYSGMNLIRGAKGFLAETVISISHAGYLHNTYNDKDLDPDTAKIVWSWLFENQDQLLPLNSEKKKMDEILNSIESTI